MRLRIPWCIQVAAYRTYQHVSSLLSRLHPRRRTRPTISFYCNYQQTTGATVAIASIANNLCRFFPVDAHIKPMSGYTKLLKLCVRQVFSPSKLLGDIVFMDIQHESDTIAALVEDSRPVVLSCHAFPEILHNVPQAKLRKNLSLTTHIHFVSQTQQREFINHYPDLDITSKSFVIGNYSRNFQHRSGTGNVGIVGLVNRAPKNALKAIQLAQQSEARTIECWGSDSVHGMQNNSVYPKLRLRGWSDDGQAIFNSFDVLVSTSESETFALVVAEALSAGIPCLLSDIPVYRELYSGCDGIIIMSGNDQEDIESLNRLLDRAPELKSAIIDYWHSNFSSEAINNAWRKKLRDISS